MGNLSEFLWGLSSELFSSETVEEILAFTPYNNQSIGGISHESNDSFLTLHSSFLESRSCSRFPLLSDTNTSS